MQTKLRIGLGLLLAAGLLGSGFALAQSGYQLSAFVVAGGGSSLQNGSYSLTGTLGQPEAGQQFSNGAYALTGGFWHNGGQKPLYQEIFLPVVIR